MVDLFTTYILASLSHKYLTLVSVLMASLEHLYLQLSSQLHYAQVCIKTKACNSTGQHSSPSRSTAGRAEEQYSRVEELLRGRPSGGQDSKGNIIGCRHELS